jgi:hypothetical protein
MLRPVSVTAGAAAAAPTDSISAVSEVAKVIFDKFISSSFFFLCFAPSFPRPKPQRANRSGPKRDNAVMVGGRRPRRDFS